MYHTGITMALKLSQFRLYFIPEWNATETIFAKILSKRYSIKIDRVKKTIELNYKLTDNKCPWSSSCPLVCWLQWGSRTTEWSAHRGRSAKWNCCCDTCKDCVTKMSFTGNLTRFFILSHRWVVDNCEYLLENVLLTLLHSSSNNGSFFIFLLV